MSSELRTAARKVRSLPNQMVKAGGDHLKAPIRASFKRDTGGDMRLSGIGNRGRFTISSSARGTSSAKGFVQVAKSMRGPASWLNSGTKPRRQGSGFHPGTPAKRTFDEPVEREIREALAEMQRLFDRALR